MPLIGFWDELPSMEPGWSDAFLCLSVPLSLAMQGMAMGCVHAMSHSQ